MDKNRIYFIVSLLIITVGIIMSNILLDNSLIYSNLGEIITYDYMFYFNNTNFIFSIGIIASSFYSQTILTDSLKYQLAFGLTRKKVFKNYILNLSILLGIILFFSLVDVSCTLIIKREILSIHIIKDILLQEGELISLYLMINFLMFVFSSLYKNWKIGYISSSVLFLFTNIITQRFNNIYLSLIFLVFSVFLAHLSYKIILKIYVGSKLTIYEANYENKTK